MDEVAYKPFFLFYIIYVVYPAGRNKQLFEEGGISSAKGIYISYPRSVMCVLCAFATELRAVAREYSHLLLLLLLILKKGLFYSNK